VAFEMAVTPTLADLGQHVSLAVGVPSVEQADMLSPTIAACVPQDHLETVLLEHAQSLSCLTVVTAAETTLMPHDGSGVRVQARDVRSGEEAMFGAQYLIAADGAHGTTRGSLGIGTVATGSLHESLTAVIRAPLWDVVGTHRYLLYAIDGSPHATGLFLPAGGGDRWIYGLEWDPSTERLADYTEQRIVHLVRAAAGVADLDVVVERTGAFQFVAELADRFRCGPVFLVGDAAHRVTPRGGTGMNSAMASGHNLAWKMAWVVKGWVAPDLLDSYEAERRPLVQHNITRSIDPEGSRRHPGDEVHVDLAGRIAHKWALRSDDRRVSTIDLVDEGSFTLFTGPDTPAERVASVTQNHRAPVTVQALDTTTAIGLGIGIDGAMLVRPDAVAVWSVTGCSTQTAMRQPTLV
jgi:putative polyketide hydroxylase